MREKRVVLDYDEKTSIHGDIHLIKYKKENTKYKVKTLIDFTNERLQVVQYKGPDYENLFRYLNFIARENRLGKIIVYSREGDRKNFLELGFKEEGIVDTFFCGKPLFFHSFFVDKEREVSKNWEKENKIIELVHSKPKLQQLNSFSLPPKYSLYRAGVQDAVELASFYKKNFETYPTPLKNSEYLKELLKKKTSIFLVIKKGEHLVSSASADIDFKNYCAEITDCATIPEERGQGLMNCLVDFLEEELKKKNLITLYSLSRAISAGINTIFFKQGYKYQGRLKNNCHIAGKFEDMNLWVKKL